MAPHRHGEIINKSLGGEVAAFFNLTDRLLHRSVDGVKVLSIANVLLNDTL